MKLPFRHRDGLRATLSKQGRHSEWLEHLREEKKSKKDTGEHPRTRRSIVVNSPLNDYWDGYWSAVIGLGNPPQYFNVTLDAGSGNFWVMDSTCGANCTGHALYHSSQSSAYSPDGTPFFLGYGTGFAQGFQGSDEWILQGGNGSIFLAIMGIPIMQATSVNSGTQQYISGILGLNWISINNVLNPVLWAMGAGVFNQPLFTAYLGTNPYSDGSVAGQVTFGALDTTNCGSVSGYAPLTAQTYWQFNVSAVGAGSQWFSVAQQGAISDTGTTNIAGPNATVQQIYAAVGASYNSSMGTWVVGCSAQYPSVNFWINGVGYPTHLQVTDHGLLPHAHWSLPIRHHTTDGECWGRHPVAHRRPIHTAVLHSLRCGEQAHRVCSSQRHELIRD